MDSAACCEAKAIFMIQAKSVLLTAHQIPVSITDHLYSNLYVRLIRYRLLVKFFVLIMHSHNERNAFLVLMTSNTYSP